MMINKIKKNFVLIEIVVAIAVVALIITGVMALNSSSNQKNVFASQKTDAYNLSNHAMDILKHLKRNGTASEIEIPGETGHWEYLSTSTEYNGTGSGGIGPGGDVFAVTTFTYNGNTRLYVGGRFTEVGDKQQIPYLAKWNKSTGRWSRVSNPGVDGTV